MALNSAPLCRRIMTHSPNTKVGTLCGCYMLTQLGRNAKWGCMKLEKKQRICQTVSEYCIIVITAIFEVHRKKCHFLWASTGQNKSAHGLLNFNAAKTMRMSRLQNGWILLLGRHSDRLVSMHASQCRGRRFDSIPWLSCVEFSPSFLPHAQLVDWTLNTVLLVWQVHSYWLAINSGCTPPTARSWE